MSPNAINLQDEVERWDELDHLFIYQNILVFFICNLVYKNKTC
jgi:hypothetical protein